MTQTLMQKIRDWTIRRKIITGFAAVLVLTGLQGWFAVRQLERLTAASNATQLTADARSTILVYRDGRTTQVDSLGSSTDASYLQGIGDERIGYSLKLEPVDRKYIIAHNAGSPDLPPITHLGINVMFVEKASSVSYFYRGKWRTLAGAD